MVLHIMRLRPHTLRDGRFGLDGVGGDFISTSKGVPFVALQTGVGHMKY